MQKKMYITLDPMKLNVFVFTCLSMCASLAYTSYVPKPKDYQKAANALAFASQGLSRDEVYKALAAHRSFDDARVGTCLVINGKHYYRREDGSWSKHRN